MDKWDKQARDNRYRNRRENPSFSSTLLDSIYRSIDDQSNGEELILYRETTTTTTTMRKEAEQKTSLQRACMIEKWMEKKVISSRNNIDPMLLNSSSTSSDSSCGTTGGFSSSESDSSYSTSAKSSSSNHYTSHHRPKPIRTSCVSSGRPDQVEKAAPKHELGGFVRTKSRALKIYSDLKKVKQPISPGGKLASFLNSLFSTAGNAKKKPKIISSSEQATTTTSTCSSASSFSRSCLSKTPSSRSGKLSSSTNGTKRSVRFCPVSVILDEDSRPCGHKNIQLDENDPTFRKVPSINNRELEFRIMEENRRVMEAAKDLLKSYQKKKEDYDMRDMICTGNETSDDEDEDDDAASYASSDLFELDNLSTIGTIERYREELPVYETTHLDTNRAIANGLLV